MYGQKGQGKARRAIVDCLAGQEGRRMGMELTPSRPEGPLRGRGQKARGVYTHRMWMWPEGQRKIYPQDVDVARGPEDEAGRAKSDYHAAV